MRCFIVFCALVAACAGQATKPKVDEKICKLGITFFTKAEVGKVTKCLEPNFWNLDPMEKVKDSLMGCVLGACPMTKYPTALGLLSEMDKCVSPSTTMKLADAAFPLAAPKMKKIYDSILAAIKKPKNNGKNQVQSLEKGYVQILAAMTRPFITEVVLKMCPGITKKEFDCVCTVGKKVADINSYTEALNKCPKLLKK